MLKRGLSSGVVVLPTRDIVFEHHTFDTMFHFYKGGIKGVITDAIMMSEEAFIKNVQEHYTAYGVYPGVKGSVICEYEAYVCSPHHSESYQVALLEELDNIEIVLDVVEQNVSTFLRFLFGRTQFQLVRPVQWIGDDLAMLVKTY